MVTGARASATSMTKSTSAILDDEETLGLGHVARVPVDAKLLCHRIQSNSARTCGG